MYVRLSGYTVTRPHDRTLKVDVEPSRQKTAKYLGDDDGGESYEYEVNRFHEYDPFTADRIGLSTLDNALLTVFVNAMNAPNAR